MDVPEPEIGPGDVLIKVLRTGICGTDLHIRLGRLGAADHADAARASATSSSARSWRSAPTSPTSRSATWSAARATWSAASAATAWPGAGTCAAPRSGSGSAATAPSPSTSRCPPSNVWVHRVPVDLDVAAIFDPFGNAVHTALSFPLVGEDVLITGAGPIGLMAAAVARHAGARNVVITDVSEERLELARKIGVSLALNVAEETIADGAARARPARGLRHRPGDVRPAGGAARHDRQHDARRPDRHAGPARRGVRGRLVARSSPR